MYDVATQFLSETFHTSLQTQFFPQFLTFKMAEESVAREDVASLQTKYDTGRDLFALEALAAPSTFFGFSSSQILLSSYITHDKDESKRKLTLH